MKLLKFIEKYKVLTITIILVNFSVGTLILLYIIHPLSWVKFSQKIINNNFTNQVIESIPVDRLNQNYVQGEIIEINNGLIKIKAEDSYYTMKINQNTPIMSMAGENDDIKISDLTIGWQVGANILGSKFISQEPFNIDYLIILVNPKVANANK